MSRCNSLYQALAKASASWSGCSWKRLAIAAYVGSARRARTDVIRWASTMYFAERVSANDERRRLLIVHGHASEGFANVPGGTTRIRVAAGSLGIDIDQAHLDVGQRSLELSVAAVALIAQP